MKIKMVKPRLEEMVFRQELLRDEATMSYNRIFGGTIDFPEARWESWYQNWIGTEDPCYFYRYLYWEEVDAYVGEAAYHYEVQTDRYLCDVIVHAKYRGRGVGHVGLALLCEAARNNGIEVLYDDILLDNPAVSLFLRSGFSEVSRSDTVVTVRKRLCDDR